MIAGKVSSLRVGLGFVFLSGLAFILLVWPQDGVPFVSAAPVNPHVVFGQVRTEGGTVLGAGYSVQARINNIHYGQSVNAATGLGSRSTVTHAADGSQLNYGTQSNFQICSDDPETSAREGGLNGNNVYFYVAGIAAQIQRIGVDGTPRNSLSFEKNQANQRVDLIIPSLTSTKAAGATASSDACTTRKAETAPTPTQVSGFGGFSPKTPTPTPQPYVYGGYFPAESPTPTPIPVDEVEDATIEDAVQMVLDATVEQAVALLTELSTERAAAITALLEAENAAEILGLVETSTAALIVGQVEVSKAAEIFAIFENLKAAALMELIEVLHAGGIVDILETTKAAAIIELVESSKAADIIEVVETAKAAAVIELIETSKAAEIIEEVETFKAAAIIELIETSKAASIIELVETSKAAQIVENVETTKAAAIISEVTPKKAGAILEEVLSAQVTEIVKEMTEVKLIERLPEISVQKLAEIPISVLFDKMPKVNADQLAVEVLPEGNPNVPAPVMTQVNSTLANYSIAETASTGWTKLVGSPAPLVTILGRFQGKNEGVSIQIQDLTAIPSGAPNLGSGQILNSIFKIDTEGLEPEDMSAVHVTYFVDQSWLEANGVHKWSLEFNRLDEDLNVWVPFPSKRSSEGDGRIVYTSVVPEFSVIAVTGREVLPERKFFVGALSVEPSSGVVGKNVTVSANATNLESSLSVYPARLWIDNMIESTQAVSVPAGDTVSFSFSVSKPEGVYSIRIERLLYDLIVGSPPPTATPTATATRIPRPTATATAVPVVPATATATPRPEPTATRVPRATATRVPTATATSVPTATAVPVLTAMPTWTPIPVVPTPTLIPSIPTAILTATPEPTTPVLEPTSTPTPSVDGGGSPALLLIIVMVVIGAIGAGAYFFYFRRRP